VEHNGRRTVVELTYPQVGATRDGALPDGYRRIVARARIGTGPRVFAAAARGLRGLDMHRGAGLKVRCDVPEVAVGTEVTVGFGVGPARLWAPCRVVWVVDEPDRYGYGYGTLPGHPESGEEAFLVSRDSQDAVWFEVRAFSRPDRWFTRLGGPLAHLMQDRVNGQYREALRRLATRA
jgi:uncharacterized protein (UPF0548 family)